MMRSESTSAFGQPSETKLTFGADRMSASAAVWSIVFNTTRLVSWSMRPLGGECRAHRPQDGVAVLVEGGLHGLGLADRAHLLLPPYGGARHMWVDPELAQGIGHFLHLGGAAGAVIGHALEVVGDDLLPIEARKALRQRGKDLRLDPGAGGGEEALGGQRLHDLDHHAAHHLDGRRLADLRAGD